MKPCTLFTVGPVQMSERTLEIGAAPLPYFRTADFSALVKDGEARFLALLNAPEGARAAFLTCSGTGGMEAMVDGLLTASDKALIIDGGSFGHRFVELAACHGVPYARLALSPGESLTEAHLRAVPADGLTAVLVNLHETSTGVLYDLALLSRYCQRNGLLLLVDAVSAFVCDELDMGRYRVDAVLTASQKALACAPGIAPVALSPRAQERISRIEPACYYLSLKAALQNGLRGQPPFTPAESALLQVLSRLRELSGGGMERERAQMAAFARAFRQAVKALPVFLLAQAPSNGVTALRVRPGVSAHGLFERLMDESRICVCPNGGDLRESVFRVGHMGALCQADYDRLLSALFDLQRRNLL